MRCPNCNEDSIPYWKVYFKSVYGEHSCKSCSNISVINYTFLLGATSLLIGLSAGLIIVLLKSNWLAIFGVIAFSVVIDFVIDTKLIRLKNKTDVNTGKNSILKIVNIVLLIIASGFFGAIFGLKVGAYLFFANTLGPTNEDLRNINVSLHTLRYLRSGEVEKAIEWVEGDLDSKVMKFFYPVKGSEKDRELTNIVLKRVKQYRSDYKRVSKYPEIDDMVNKVLSNVDISTSRPSIQKH